MLAVAEIHETSQLDEQHRAASTLLDESPLRRAARRPEPATPIPRAMSRTAPDIDPKPLAATAPVVVVPEEAHGFRLLQQWEGVVIDVTEEGFTAILRDLTNRKNPEERAEFGVDQIDPPDRRLIIPGAIFYWWIGYRDAPTGTRWTVSTIRARRLPAWSPTDMRRIERDAEELRRLFATSD